LVGAGNPNRGEIMRATRLWALAAAVVLVASCGNDRAGSPGSQPSDADAALAPVPRVEPSSRSDAVARSAPELRLAEVPDAVAQGPISASRLQELEQPAIWPAADVVFATPEEAAADFVREVLISEGEPELGEFQQGDARSGEIVVFFPGETEDAEPFERGLLALRQLGPSDGWFVIAALSDGATITSPEPAAVVPAGPLTVEGAARGFEATVVVKAFPAGDAATVLDMEIVQGGAFDTNEPYETTLDLTDSAPGEMVTVLVQGDTGLGNDPSTFAAIPVLIEDVIPPTR
jgi:hypothetical protein